MSDMLDALIKKAESLTRDDEVQSALEIANGLIESNPERAEVWLLRAYIHGRSRNYRRAIEDLTEAISISRVEPSIFFDRGRYQLQVREYGKAIEDFSEGLGLCDYHQNDYYRDALHFFRAEAYLQLGRRRKVLADLEHVHDDLPTWTTRLRTKSELLQEALALPDDG
jgi:tetratricopeptide (TPR) repeat protein